MVVGDEERELRWSYDPEREAPLLRLRVYDIKCGDSYVRSGAEASVLPGPAQRVATLASFLDALRRALQERASALEAGCRFDPADGTAVAEAWYERDSDQLEALAKWSEDDAAQLAFLLQGQRFKDTDLDSAAGAWDARAFTLGLAKEAILRAKAALEPARLREFREREDRIQALESELGTSESLGRLDAKGLRQLFAVAHRVAPSHVDGRAFCPLCDRDFDDDELNDYRLRLASADAESALTLDALRRQQDSDLALWSAVHAQLDELVLDDAPEATRWVQQAISLLAALLQGGGSDTKAIATDPLAELQALIDDARDRRQALSSLAKYEGDWERELAELESRRQLAQDDGAAVLAQVAKLETAATLRAAVDMLGTRSLTTIQSDLVEALMTASYRSTLRQCLGELLPGRPVRLKQRGSKGRVQYSLELEGATKGSKLHDVLSDGERRMAGLAFFLTEAEVIGAGETLVFDDPVCSVDEVRRDRVARRLARLARDRQVIVITHDLVFVEMLCRHAGTDEPTLFECRRAGIVAGLITDGLEVAVDVGAAVKAVAASASRLQVLEQQVAEGKRNLEELSSESQAYRRALRVAVERIVEKRVLRGVVRRFDRAVHTGMLPKVELSQDVRDLVQELMNEASRELHDSTVALAPSCLDAASAALYLERLRELKRLSREN
ncbi:MAG: hypothetical protein JJ863_38465 [Deltaproteobacteria bacterium]|nr:hypothetical protein [Deltaproteobacteria bacterium]